MAPLVVGIVFVLISCNSEPTLIGMWVNKNNEGIEFKADGQIGNFAISNARYTVKDANHMTWILPIEGETVEFDVEYILTRTTLTLTPKSGTNMSVLPPELRQQEFLTRVY